MLLSSASKVAVKKCLQRQLPSAAVIVSTAGTCSRRIQTKAKDASVVAVSGCNNNNASFLSNHRRCYHQSHIVKEPAAEAGMTKAEAMELTKEFESIVGNPSDVLDGHVENWKTEGYLKGQRLGHGTAVAIVRPNKLGQLPQIVRAAVNANCTIIVQGSNTGLTGSSVPNGDHTESAGGRPTVVISMKHLNKILPIDDGTKMLCQAGVGLAQLQSYVDENVPGRMSHSVLGSTFLNPTTAAGVAFGSGGTQIRKGPSTTERALYLKVADDGKGKPTVKVVNTLGIQDLDSQEGEYDYDGKKQYGDGGTIIDKLDGIAAGNVFGNYRSNSTYGAHPSSDTEYSKSLCTFDDEITRFNADTKGLECNRSEGKVLILATVHDTFPKPKAAKSYWFSFDDFDTAIKFKTDVALTDSNELPESIEYIDRGAYDVIDRSGRFMGQFIKFFGTTSPLVRTGWDIKVMIEALPIPGMSTFPDQVQYTMNNIIPSVLPKNVTEMGKKYGHHILLTVGNHDDEEANAVEAFEKRLKTFREENDTTMAVEELTTQSAKDGVNAFRYIAAGAFETYCVGKNLQPVSIDYGLPKNKSEAPVIPSDSPQPAMRMRYSHFGCNVVHEDLAYEKGVDTHSAKMAFKKVVDEVCGGRLPSEHGHGIEYVAPIETKLRWMKMDPFNVMNPGVGGLSTEYKYGTHGESLTNEEMPHSGWRGARPDRT